MEVLAEAFVIDEEESFVSLDGAAKGAAELVALEGRRGTLVEVIGCVECVIAEELEECAVPLIGAGLGDDDDLATGAFAELGAVGIALHIEFADGVDTEQHATGSAGLHIIFGGSGVFDTVQKEKILLGAIAGDSEIAGGTGIGNAGATGVLRSEIDDAGIEGKQEIVATAVEWEIFDGLLANQAANILRGGAYHGRITGYVDLRFDGTDLQRNIDGGLLADDEVNSGVSGVLKILFGDADFVLADGKG